MTDRFANGDATNDAGSHPALPGAYHGGDFAGLLGKLDYLRDLGVGLVWISPVFANIAEPQHGAGGKGPPHWGFHGYWPHDFDHVNEHFGTWQSLRALVDGAHERGLGLFIDIVVNHVGYGAPLSQRADWTRSPARGDCGQDDVDKCIYGLPDLRTEQPAVATALVRAYSELATRSGCDGFRVDAVKHVGLPFLAQLRQAVVALHPGFRFLGEVWGTRATNSYGDPWLKPGQMDWLFDFEFADQAVNFVTGVSDARALDEYLSARAGRAGRYVHYLDTHDVPAFLTRVGGDKAAMKLGAALELTVPGIPLVYYGDEVGRTTTDWPEHRSDMPWGAAQDTELLAYYRKLIAARRELRGPLTRLHADGAHYGFRRGAGVVLINAGDGEWKVPVPGPAVDVLTDKRVTGSFRLAGRTAAVLLPAPPMRANAPVPPVQPALLPGQRVR
jgi:alpha-amylase